MKVILIDWEDNLPLLWYLGNVNSTSLWKNQVLSENLSYPYPETSLILGMPRDKPYHPCTLHFRRPPHRSRDIPYCPVHSIHFRRPPHGSGTCPIAQYTTYPSEGHHMAQETTPQSLQHTLPSGTEHTQQCTKLLQDNKTANTASQHRRALFPRDTVRHISKKIGKISKTTK